MIAAASVNQGELGEVFCLLLILAALLCLILGLAGLVTAWRSQVQPGAALVVSVVLFLVWAVVC